MSGNSICRCLPAGNTHQRPTSLGFHPGQHDHAYNHVNHRQRRTGADMANPNPVETQIATIARQHLEDRFQNQVAIISVRVNPSETHQHQGRLTLDVSYNGDACTTPRKVQGNLTPDTPPTPRTGNTTPAHRALHPNHRRRMEPTGSSLTGRRRDNRNRRQPAR